MTAINRSTFGTMRGVGWAFLGFLAIAGPNAATLAGAPKAAERVSLGRDLFFRDWVPDDPRTHHGDGLGPLYNDTSCVACHNLGAPGGGGPASKNVEIISLSSLTRLKQAEIDEIHPGLRTASSVLLHRYGTDPEYRLWRLRRTDGVELAEMAETGGEQELKQLKEVVQMKVGPSARPLGSLLSLTSQPNRTKGSLLFGALVTLTRRNAPPLFGAGLINAIPAKTLREAATAHHRGFDAVKGRLSKLPDGRIGRFGWKAQTASLKDFVESACAMELGLEVPTHHQARAPLDFDSKKPAALDLTQDECDALTAYVASIPSPSERPDAPDVIKGRTLFEHVGCATCHLPKLGTINGIYSDLLLHAMGSDLSDSAGYYGSITPSSPDGPTADEWRTPPLWGFRDSGPYLHDGRAETLEQAVAYHGGQGEESAKLFFGLSLRSRLKVQSFLNSLAAPEVVR
jgi:CxxC motif-containing protein (DUF1111 family)